MRDPTSDHEDAVLQPPRRGRPVSLRRQRLRRGLPGRVAVRDLGRRHRAGPGLQQPRGWTESVWHNSYGGPGSGCSMYEPKPAFQTDTGCDKRAVADVSAVADPETGVAVYTDLRPAAGRLRRHQRLVADHRRHLRRRRHPGRGHLPQRLPVRQARLAQRRHRRAQRHLHPGIPVHRGRRLRRPDRPRYAQRARRLPQRPARRASPARSPTPPPATASPARPSRSATTRPPPASTAATT